MRRILFKTPIYVAVIGLSIIGIVLLASIFAGNASFSFGDKYTQNSLRITPVYTDDNGDVVEVSSGDAFSSYVFVGSVNNWVSDWGWRASLTYTASQIEPNTIGFSIWFTLKSATVYIKDTTSGNILETKSFSGVGLSGWNFMKTNLPEANGAVVPVEDCLLVSGANPMYKGPSLIFYKPLINPPPTYTYTIPTNDIRSLLKVIASITYKQDVAQGNAFDVFARVQGKENHLILTWSVTAQISYVGLYDTLETTIPWPGENQVKDISVDFTTTKQTGSVSFTIGGLSVFGYDGSLNTTITFAITCFVGGAMILIIASKKNIVNLRHLR
jgi:hypothetical protein